MRRLAGICAGPLDAEYWSSSDIGWLGIAHHIASDALRRQRRQCALNCLTRHRCEESAGLALGVDGGIFTQPNWPYP